MKPTLKYDIIINVIKGEINMNTQQLENLFKDLDIIKEDPTQNGSVLLHGTIKSDGFVDSCFENGLYKNPNASVLSTIYLNNDKVTNIDPERIVGYNYGCDKNEIVRTVVVHLPKTLGNMYLGNVYINEGERNGNGGLQNGKHCLLDCILTDNIPTEFIVGVIERNQNEEDNFEFKMNPNYYGINPKREAKITAELTAEISSNPAYAKFTGLEPLTKSSVNMLARIFTDHGMFSGGGLYNFAKDLIVHSADASWIGDENLSELVQGAFVETKNYMPQYLLDIQTLDTDDLIEQLNNLANDNQDTDSNDFEI